MGGGRDSTVMEDFTRLLKKLQKRLPQTEGTPDKPKPPPEPWLQNRGGMVLIRLHILHPSRPPPLQAKKPPRQTLFGRVQRGSQREAFFADALSVPLADKKPAANSLRYLLTISNGEYKA